MRTRTGSGVVSGRLESQNCTGSSWSAGHSASSQRTGSSAVVAAWRISRPAGLIRRATKREYMRLNPLRPLPGRDPSLYCTGRAEDLPAAMTRLFTLCAGSG